MKSTRSAYDGSATSQPPVTLPLASSTPEASPTCNPTMFDNTDKHTFLPESEVGLSPCNWQDGRQMLLFGPEAALANRFRAPESEGGTPTSDTSGPLGSDLSASAALQSSLASRLHQRMDSNGSMEYSLTWKTRVTPAGRPICALRASGRRTSGKGCTGWPTPQTHDTQEQGKGRELTETGRIRCHNGDSHSLNLPGVVQLTGWVSPMARDHSRGVLPPRPTDTGVPLSQQVSGLTGWATPTLKTSPQSRDNKCLARDAIALVGTDSDQWQLTKGSSQTKVIQAPETQDHSRRPAVATERQPVLGHLGLISSSSPAETTAPAASVLNPAMARWLQGFPANWDQSSPGWTEWESVQHALTESADSKATATPSFPKSQRSLSEQ